MRGPTYAFPMTRGEVPNVLSSRMRTAWPETVTRAIIRTVVFESVLVLSPLCEVPHAVTHRSAAGAGCRAAVPESSSRARPITSPTLDRTRAFVMRGVYRQIAVVGAGFSRPDPVETVVVCENQRSHNLARQEDSAMPTRFRSALIIVVAAVAVAGAVWAQV